MTTQPPDDSRLVQVEVEVPGTPEQVWEAIATGPGMACWFVPAEVDEREGGTITTHHGPWGDSTGTVTAWEPPHRFAYEERDWQPPEAGAPPWATEILVEARAGGTCLVRLVSGLFSDAADWADEIEPTEEGWKQGLENLRIYMTHFAGWRCSSLLVVGNDDRPAEESWASLAGALGLEGAAEGERAESGGEAPRLRGTVEAAKHNGIVLRTEEPAPGIVELFAFRWRGPSVLTVRGYLYGDAAPGAVEREEPEWREWMAERFPFAGMPA